MKAVFFILISMLTMVANAGNHEFKLEKKQDEFDDSIIYTAVKLDETTQGVLLFYCNDKQKQLMVTIGDRREYYGISEAAIQFRVDKNNMIEIWPISFGMERRVFIPTSELITQLKTGGVLKLRVNTKTELFDYKFDLTGSVAALDHVVPHCK